MRRLVPLFALVVACSLVPTPSVQAAATTPEPTVAWPLHRDGSGRVVVQLDAPLRAWGIRLVARNIDAKLDHVRLHRWGTCEDRPHAWCVRVNLRDYGDTGWVGRAYGSGIDLNTFYDDWSRHVACHELGHILGIPHHDAKGCVGWPGREGQFRDFSAGEVAALRDYYESPPVE